MCLVGSDDGYETVQVQERKLTTFGVDIAKLEAPPVCRINWMPKSASEHPKLRS